MNFDPRLTQLGVKLIPCEPARGVSCWRVTDAKWLDPTESQGRHSIFVEVLDENFKRVVGKMVRCSWATGAQVKPTEQKPNDPYALDFPIFAVGNSYSVQLEGLSDVVEGMGLGTIEQPSIGYHTSFMLTFRLTADEVPPAPPLPVIDIYLQEDAEVHIHTHDWVYRVVETHD